jgi:hypothetical protein
MLLCRLAASTSLGVVGSMTQPSALACSTTAFLSSILGPHSTPSLGTYPWYLDSSASFHMAPHPAHLSSLHPSYRHCTVHTAGGSPLSVAGQGTLSSNYFDVHDLTMQLMSARQITDHARRVILDPNFCYIQDCRTGHLVGTGPHFCGSERSHA